jgi:hypothetical protein
MNFLCERAIEKLPLLPELPYWPELSYLLELSWRCKPVSTPFNEKEPLLPNPNTKPASPEACKLYQEQVIEKLPLLPELPYWPELSYLLELSWRMISIARYSLTAIEIIRQESSNK